MREMLFGQNGFVRLRTLKALEATTEAMADEVAVGHKNSIRWNLGHILVSQENLMYLYGASEPGQLPSEYNDLFKGGTKPSDWKTQPPSLDKLHSLLEEQQTRLENRFGEHLNEKIAKPFKMGPTFEINTIGEILNFTIWHEGLHQGAITSIKFSLGVSDLWTPHTDKEKV